MKKLLWLLLIPSFLTFLSCETDLPVDEYKDVPIVYCILNVRDSVHYVRINRGFLTGEDAYLYLQDSDSVSYDPAILEVVLEEYEDSTLTNRLGEIAFQYTDDIPKDTGLFANARNNIFKAVHDLDLTMQRAYVLRVKNKQNGHEARGMTRLLGHRNLHSEFNDPFRAYKRNMYVPEELDYENGSLFYMDYSTWVIRFLYKEVSLVTQDTAYKYVDRIEASGFLKSITDDSLQLSDEDLLYLRDNIPVNNQVKRYSIGMDKMIAIANEEFLIYIYNYNHPFDPHFNPSYTNVEEGLGVVSARYYYTFHAVKFSLQTRDSIRFGRYTKHLSFQ